MTISVFDLFTIGVGPSSSHTVGPMKAAADFIARIGEEVVGATHVEVELFGSLAATGHGHGTLTAVLLGLEGRRPDAITGDEIRRRTEEIERDGTLRLAGAVRVPFREADIRLSPRTILPTHVNALRLAVKRADGKTIDEAIYYSTGGGFISRDGDPPPATSGKSPLPHPYATAEELLARCRRSDLSIADLMLRNERAALHEAEVRSRLLRIRDVMQECVEASLTRAGTLPGGLNVQRRAPLWHERLRREDPEHTVAFAQEWVNLVALAVNEENASGGRVVTAPTNGAAGVIPAVLHYATFFTAAGVADPDDVTVRFLLTAGAIGVLYKTRASISGAEVGCQGEVGSASSMAAGALTEVLGGTPEQVENAAEIAMEHNLGLTCDPVGGLVQIPCIERNAIAANKAISAARMAMWGDGNHRVSLDTVIETMRQTGRDMSHKYKETALAGLAVNVVEC
ncbi:L-serine ammonia-lyase [Microbacterium aurum]